MTRFTFRVEVTQGQDLRQVPADSFSTQDGWLIFYQEGEEYWRVNTSMVVSMETRRNPENTSD